ncbi:MAG: hypothetical protein MUC79_04030, partial [Thiobacillaceae bacterium]|nr:hypothetical protein [Thiobacillaceae bacterium]
MSLSPRLLKAGLVALDPQSGNLRRVIPLQYNPDSLTRSVEPRFMAVPEQGGALRFAGPADETLRLEAELDATDGLERPDEHPDTAKYGVAPLIAALETLAQPSGADLNRVAGLAAAGVLEIAAPEAPLVLFVWSAERVTPVRITELSVIEEAFSPGLQPLRAKVSLGLKVLSVTDLGFGHKGGSLYQLYHANRERLAALET